jgi:hypothetical protein
MMMTIAYSGQFVDKTSSKKKKKNNNNKGGLEAASPLAHPHIHQIPDSI